MASALAAAAVGAGGAGGAGGAVSGSGSGASAPTAGAGAAGSASASSVGSHHDDMEIKPEIAEMIREEERVSSKSITIYFYKIIFFIIFITNRNIFS